MVVTGALKDVTDEPMQRKISSTLTKFAAVRGDFRYQAAALVTKRGVDADWLDEEVNQNLHTLLSKIMIPHIDDVEETSAAASLKSSDMITTLLHVSILHNDANVKEDINTVWPNEEKRPSLSYCGLTEAGLLIQKVTRHAIAEARSADDDWYYTMKPFFVGETSFTFASMCEQV